MTKNYRKISYRDLVEFTKSECKFIPTQERKANNRFLVRWWRWFIYRHCTCTFDWILIKATISPLLSSKRFSKIILLNLGWRNFAFASQKSTVRRESVTIPILFDMMEKPVASSQVGWTVKFRDVCGLDDRLIFLLSFHKFNVHKYSLCYHIRCVDQFKTI